MYIGKFRKNNERTIKIQNNKNFRHFKLPKQIKIPKIFSKEI